LPGVDHEEIHQFSGKILQREYLGRLNATGCRIAENPEQAPERHLEGKSRCFRVVRCERTKSE
jgi:hypothetical protein